MAFDIEAEILLRYDDTDQLRQWSNPGVDNPTSINSSFVNAAYVDAKVELRMRGGFRFDEDNPDELVYGLLADITVFLLKVRAGAPGDGAALRTSINERLEMLRNVTHRDTLTPIVGDTHVQPGEKLQPKFTQSYFRSAGFPSRTGRSSGNDTSWPNVPFTP